MSCTFATLFDILYQGQNSTPKMSKPGFLDIMIPVLDDEGARFQELHKSYISHMFSGAERFPVNVAHFYEKKNQFEALKERFRNKILPMLEFPEVTLAKIRNEIETDPYMLTAKKEQLLSLYDDAAAFLTAVLRYTMSIPLKQLPQNESLDLCQIILGHKPPKPCEGFCGRENELKEMHDVLSTHKRVFLSGIAGLGKSEIMAAYASNHSKDYSNIIWLRCAESLHKSIQKLTVKGNPYEYSAEEAYHYRDQLLRALPENALLILDSVDWPSYDDPVLQDMLINYNCHIAVTTRCPVDDDPVVTVGPIRCDEDRFQIMRSIFKDADAHQKTIEKIIAELDYHTMAIALAASLLQNSQLSPELLLRNIYKRNLIQDFKDRILLKRVQERRMARYSDHIKLLFRLSQLSEAEKQVLCGLVVMPVDGIREQIFAPLMLINDLSDVHRLVDLGYIRRNEDRHLALYSLIGETVQTEIGLDMSRLKNLYQAVDAVLRQQWRWKLLDPCVVEDIVEHLAQLTCPECQAENRVIYHNAWTYYDRYGMISARDCVLQKIKQSIETDPNATTRDRALLLIYDSALLRDAQPEKSVDLLIRADQLISADEDTAILKANIRSNLGMLCFSLGQNAQAEAYLLSASALYNDYKIGICEDYIAHEINYCTYLAGSNRTVESLSKLRGLHNDVLSYDAACPLLWHIEAAIGSVLQAMGRLIDGRKWLANAYNRYRTLYGDHTADAAQLRALMDSCQ